MSHYDPAEELSAEAETRLASLPRTMDGDDIAEERTVAALRRNGLLHPPSDRLRRPLFILSAIAAAMLLFVAGDGYGRLRSLLAQRPDTVVRMAGPPRHPGRATLVEELNIGVLNGADEYMFGRIFDMTVAKDGSIYVYDRSIGAIRGYDAAGKSLGTFGRRGQGPGEVEAPSGMAVLPNGQLALHDSQLKRVNIYSATGANVLQLRLPPAGGSIGHRRGFAVDTAGFVYAKRNETTLIPPEQRVAGQPPYHSLELWLRLRVSDGAVVDTIREPEWPAYPEPFRATNARGWRQMGMPFTPPRLMTISPIGYAVTGLPDRYAFELVISSRRIISVRRDVAPPPVSAAEHAATRDRIETRMREVDPGWSWNGRDVPRVKPLYTEIDVGQDGRIWLTRDITPLPQPRAPSTGRTGGSASTGPSPDEPFAAKPTLFDVFEPDGRFIGAVQAPPMVTLMVMRGEHVWGTFRDSNDVEFVKRYRIVWH